MKIALRLVLVLALALAAGGCESTDSYWSFPVTRTTGFFAVGIPLRLKAYGTQGALQGLAVLGFFTFLPVALDIALLPITVPHDLWVALNASEVLFGKTSRKVKPEKETYSNLCIRNLEVLWASVLKYRKKTGDLFPPHRGEMNLEAIAAALGKADEAAFRCPNRAESEGYGYETLDNRPGSPTSLAALEHRGVSPAIVPLAWDRKGNHPGFRHILFLDGHVEVVSDALFVLEFSEYDACE